MAKLSCDFPASLDTLDTDRESGQDVTSDSYDIIETAITQLEIYVTDLQAGAMASGVTIAAKEENTSAIVKGQPVYNSGSAGVAKPLIGFGDCNDNGKAHIIGLASEAIGQNGAGLVRVAGLLEGVDSLGATAINPADETWAAGDQLFLSATVGGLTNVRPTSGHIVEVGWSLYGSSNTDAILVHIDTPSHGVHVAAGDDVVLRMGASDDSTKVLFKDFANAEVGYVDDGGNADFTSLTLDTALAIAQGGTGLTTGAMTGLTSILNAALYVGRDADNQIKFAADNTIVFRVNGVDGLVMTADGLDLGEKNIVLDFTLTADHSYSGITDVVTVGETVAFGELLYYDDADSEWKIADASGSGTMPALCVALEAKDNAEACKVLRYGYIRDDSWDWTVADMLYVSETAGDFVATAPADSGDQVQRVGYAIHADKIFFNPSMDVGEI